MKTHFTWLRCLISLFLLSTTGLTAQNYIVLTWNDLGMHCCNKDFSLLGVLPPYNNLYSQAVKLGDANNSPKVVTASLKVSYEVPGNTYSVGKTNFWTYAQQLFGVTLANNIGLTGKGLTGYMDAQTGYFNATGIPLTPYTDADLVNEDPFQLATVKLFDMNNNQLAGTQNVIPVSNELTCVQSGCHTSEATILQWHTTAGGFDATKTPILCASCHSSNALGTPGVAGVKSLSEAMHNHHAPKTNDCYSCHPGPKTQCYRDIMSTKMFTCHTCHGSVADVANTTTNGRRPWLDEPQCGNRTCHGSNFEENPGKLFRQSTGHGGLYCSACHGSPHAVVPSTQPRDNIQNIALQGEAGTLSDCRVCHGVYPTGPGPHGKMAPGISQDTMPPDVQYTMDINGNVTGTIKDLPDNPAIRTNLGMILFHPADGFNWSFSYKDITPGVDSMTTFTMTVIDKTIDAQADASFVDENANKNMVTFSYYCPDLVCMDGKVDMGSVQANTEATKTCKFMHSLGKTDGVLPHTVTNVVLASGHKGFNSSLLGLSPPFDIQPNDSMMCQIMFKNAQTGTYYDTLIITDVMGRKYYAPLIANAFDDVGDNQPSTMPVIDIIPEPVNDISKVVFRNISTKNFDLIITDETGRIISKYRIDAIENLYEFELPTDNLPNGVYFINVSNKELNLVKKFRVIR